MVLKPTGRRVVANSGNNKAAPPEPLRVAAFGDSLMWGQGLNRHETFATLIARALATHHKQKVEISVNRSRSGAQIKARNDPETRRDQREEFLDRFPFLFPDGQTRDAFASGADERFANGLHGEIPATFPTIQWQVAAVDDALGRKIDVVLLSGGANDIRFDVVLNPQNASGKFIQEWDDTIRQIAHDDVLDLIRRVRTKCPNAVILVFGYYAPISHSSHVSKIRDFFKHEADDSFGWALNRFFKFVDVDAKIREARVRSIWAQGRAQHWIRSAVTAANLDAAVRGRGVLFIPSGMRSDQAAFADNSAVHSDFIHPTQDPAQAEREKQCPRISQLEDMRNAFFLVGQSGFAPNVEILKRLLNGLEAVGPRSIVEDLRATLDGKEPAEDLREAIAGETRLIQRALIASFLHPNATGARQYADIAMNRYRTHLELVAKIQADKKLPGPLKTPAQPGAETLEAKLRRFNLRGADSLLGDAGHLEVDALSVHVATGRDSDPNLAPNLVLIVEVRRADGSVAEQQHQLNFKYHFVPSGSPELPIRMKVQKLYPHFEPDGTDHFTVDTAGRLKLDSIIGMKLALVPDDDGGAPAPDDGKTWRPRRVDLEINGVKVFGQSFEGVEVEGTRRLDLSFPPPPEQFKQPKLA
jgi:lysophospholipase L1-like esterase